MDTQPNKLKNLIDYLKKQKNVWWIGTCDGEWDFVFAIWTKSNKEFSDFFHKLNLDFRKNIKEKMISPLVSYTTINRRYLLESNKKISSFSVGESKKTEVDQIDKEILNLLSKNARIPLIDLAVKLKLDSMTIYHRIKKLEEKKIIKGYRLDIDVKMLERDFYSIKINLKDVKKIEEIKKYILTILETTAITEAIGGYDIEFDLEVKDSKQYFKIIENLKNQFEFIREIIYFRVLQNYKILYMPDE